MKQISRETADNLIRVYEPLNSQIDQSADNLCIIINLSNGLLLKVIQDRKDYKKKYFIREE